LSVYYDIPPLELVQIKQTWEFKNLMPITLIFGKSGSGKSLYLKTLNRVNRETESKPKNFLFNYSTFYIMPERTGEFKITSSHPNQIQANVESMQFSATNFVQNFNEYALQQFNSLSSNIGHKYDKNFQFDIIPKYILSEISKFFPNYKIEFNTSTFELDITLNGEVINSNLLSSGESQLISICILLLTKIANWKLDGEQGLILFDEPDLHLDPQMQERLALFISDLQKKHDVKFLIATHSIIFMTALSLMNKNIGWIYLDRSKTKLFPKKLSNKMISFELFLNGKFLTGTLNDIPMLLVEGKDDELIFQTANRNPYFNAYVFPCGGEEIYQYQEFAENLFRSSYSDEKIFGCALLDADKKLPQNKDQKFIEFIKLICHESENLYFTNEVLESMIPDNTNLSARLQKLKIEDKLNDKIHADFKDVIHQAANELDPEGLTWQERVGKVIGKQRPTGELASFLGEQLLDMLWPNNNSN